MGGSSSGGKTVKTKAKTTTQVKPVGKAKPIVSGALKTAQQFQKNAPQAPQPVGFDPLQTQAQNQYVSAAQGPIQGLANQATAGQNLLLDPNLLRAESNPYLTSYIDAAIAPLTESYQNVQLPGLRSGEITNTGLYGGSRGEIGRGLATQGYQRSLEDTTSKIAYPAYQQGLENLRQNIAATPNVQGMNLVPGTVLDAVGAQRRGLAEQTQATDYLNQWLPYLVAQDTAGFAAGLPGATQGVSNAQQTGVLPPAASTGTSGLGGALMGASLGSSLLPGAAAGGTGIGATALGGGGIGGVLGALLGAGSMFI